MKKVLAIIVLIFFAVVYTISMSPNMMRIVTEYRFPLKSLIASDKYAYGDLYGMSYLPEFKRLKKEECVIPLQTLKCDRTVNLFAICDSYLHNFLKDEKSFYRAKKYVFVKSGDLYPNMSITIDTTQVNVLLIETTERFLYNYADSNFAIKKLCVGDEASIKKEPGVSSSRRFYTFLREYKFNPRIDQNLEFNLFDYRFITPIKELKAELNFKIFGRLPSEVAISPDHKYLFLKNTVDPTHRQSIFKPVPEKSVSQIVKSLNAIYLYYRKKGFDKVYFSVIPNPATVYYSKSEGYNQLIPKVQNHPDRKFEIFNIYDTFINASIPLYQACDTHWNINGLNLWLNAFNAKLDSFCRLSPKEGMEVIK